MHGRNPSSADEDVALSDVVSEEDYPEADQRSGYDEDESPREHESGGRSLAPYEVKPPVLRSAMALMPRPAIRSAPPIFVRAPTLAPRPMVRPEAPSGATPDERPAASPQQDRGPAVAGAAVAPRSRRGATRIILAIVLSAAALGLTVVGLTVNTHFAASFGQTAQAAALLAAIGLVIDILAIVLPSAAAQLWRDRNLFAACSAWGIWLIALSMTLLAAIGFAATNIGDGVAGRSKVATEATGLATDVV